jgi:hypothetical protein
MIINLGKGRSIDTAKDLSAEERHILQKLFAWKSVADSLDQFRSIKERAMQTGWNNSGPVRETPVMKAIIHQMEKQLAARLRNEK